MGFRSLGLEVYIAADFYQRHLWDSKLFLVTIVIFSTNMVILIVNLYLIVVLFILGLVPLGFSCETSLVYWFPRSLYPVSYLFSTVQDIDACLINIKLSQ